GRNNEKKPHAPGRAQGFRWPRPLCAESVHPENVRAVRHLNVEPLKSFQIRKRKGRPTCGDRARPASRAPTTHTEKPRTEGVNAGLSPGTAPRWTLSLSAFPIHQQ